MLLPSGDHVGPTAGLPSVRLFACFVTARGVPPAAGMSISWPARPKRIDVPSGDHRIVNWTSLLPPDVSATGALPMSWRQRRYVARFAVQSAALSMYATLRPSGDSC